MKSLKQELEELKAKLPFSSDADKFQGICWHLTSTNQELFIHLLLDWPKHSGDPWFPIYDPTVEGKAVDQYITVIDCWEGKSGELRREAIEYVLGQLDSRLRDFVVQGTITGRLK